MDDLMRELERTALDQYDGHFTIMRFTTNWRVCFYTPGRISRMAEGATFEDAAKSALSLEADEPGGWYERLSGDLVVKRRGRSKKVSI